MFLCMICRIPVRLNMSLPKIKCDFVGIDIQDDMGRHEVGFVENTVKTPLGVDEEGCLFEARFHIKKVRKSKSRKWESNVNLQGVPSARSPGLG